MDDRREAREARKWRNREVESEVEKILSGKVGRMTDKQMRKMEKMGG